jgi:hypothetical protein
VKNVVVIMLSVLVICSVSAAAPNPGPQRFRVISYKEIEIDLKFNQINLFKAARGGWIIHPIWFSSTEEVFLAYQILSISRGQSTLVFDQLGSYQKTNVDKIFLIAPNTNRKIPLQTLINEIKSSVNLPSADDERQALLRDWLESRGMITQRPEPSQNCESLLGLNLRGGLNLGQGIGLRLSSR